MKKIIVFLLTFTMILSMTAFAKNGDVIGKIYSTDIKAYINGVQVDSYNIGGKTVVVIEDIIGLTNRFLYNDALRTLIIYDLDPACLVSGEKEYTGKSGTPVGNIYQTDINVYYRGNKLTAYSLNGKMAVEIEQLGDDNSFSDIGGKFVWNPDNRTISLETMYSYEYSLHNRLKEKHLNMVLTETDGVLKAEFVPNAKFNGNIYCEYEVPQNSIIPVLYNDEIIGYRCKFPKLSVYTDEGGKPYLKENPNNAVDHFNLGKIEELIRGVIPLQPTYEDWKEYFYWNNYYILKEFETEDYVFLYMSQNLVLVNTQHMYKINKKDGTLVEYSAQFESVSVRGNKYFDDVTIDEENKKVRFGYDTWYIIDLETDKIEKE